MDRQVHVAAGRRARRPQGRIGETAHDHKTVQMNRVYIKASAQAIWDAITKPEWTVKYGYQAPVEYDLRVGGAYRGLASDAMKEHGGPDVIVDGEILEVDPPHRLVQTWRAIWIGEPATTLTYEIVEKGNGVCCLTVTHDVTGCAADRRAGRGQHRWRGRRLGRGAQRPQVVAGDREIGVRVMKRLAIAVIAGLVALAAPAVAAPPQSIGNAKFRVEVPSNWNGTLLLYSHGYYPVGIAPDETLLANRLYDTPEWLLRNGFALAASDFEGLHGLAIEPAVRDQIALLDWFEANVGKPRRTIATGTSMGGGIAAQLAERNPGRFQGVLAMCGEYDPQSTWNTALDVTFTVKDPAGRRSGHRPGEGQEPGCQQ
ncbi:SRPBCC domain-containing protein [Kibdelosporangium philippinense]|uniref:SRPBCC domain-containing protein n=1 Tax=Kibdelosporangium philippinense TaxID=211113 RepID=UPI0036170C15